MNTKFYDIKQQLGMTIEQLAEHLAKSPSTVKSYMNGMVSPGASVMRDMLALLEKKSKK